MDGYTDPGGRAREIRSILGTRAVYINKNVQGVRIVYVYNISTCWSERNTDADREQRGKKN